MEKVADFAATKFALNIDKYFPRFNLLSEDFSSFKSLIELELENMRRMQKNELYVQ